MARKQQNGGLHEILGIILLGLGVLIFLSLLSYNPKDLPEWIPISQSSPQNSPVQNFIGPVGAVIAGYLYFLIGGAAYLIAVLFLGFGGAKLLSDRIFILRRMVWIVLFLLCGACLLHLQSFALQDWKEEFNIQGPGGWLGYFFGEKVMKGLLGPVGAPVLILCLYLISLILLANIRPILLIRRMREEIRNYFERLEQKRLEKADVNERIRLDQKRIEREEKRIHRALKKQGKRPQNDNTNSPETVSDLPEPRIIDTSATPLPRKQTSKPSDKETEELPILASGDYTDYKLPDIELLTEPNPKDRPEANYQELIEIQETIIDTLEQFNITVSKGDITRGPTITRYEVYPAKGIRVDKIVSLERDIARATRAERINILAPIPGKDTVGIEIANSRKVTVTLREIIESDIWANTDYRIPIVLGKDVYGKIILGDLAAMPHCLIAGTTGSGKSVCVNAIVASILYRFKPEELRFIMIDPKVVEMQIYNKLPHLIVPVVTDPKKVLIALRSVINEMEKRYKIFAKTGVRNIVSFNALAANKAKPKENVQPAEPEDIGIDEDMGDAESVADTFEEAVPIRVPRDEDLVIPDHLPYIVVIVDELADLMQTAPADVESAIARITQMARAAGIHMIVATQTPRADVVTGIIKANIPSRIAFQVASKIDSRVILDENGAERLIGKGDMLYLPPGTSRLTRSQGVLVTDSEIQNIVDYVSSQAEPDYNLEIQEQLSSNALPQEDVSEEDEILVEKCLEVIRQEKRASTSMLQRRLRLGYTRAARIVDILEQRGILGPGEGAKPREILVDLDADIDMVSRD